VKNSVSWRQLARRFLTLGLTGFGGPSAHIAQMHHTWVDSEQISSSEFSHAFAATTILPGPTSTQMALWIGWRLKGWRGTLVAGTLFILPSVVMVTLLASQLDRPGFWSVHVTAAATGASLAVPGIAAATAVTLWRNHREEWSRAPHPPTARRTYSVWLIVAFALGIFPTIVNPFFVLVGAGLIMMSLRHVTTGPLLIGVGGTAHALPPLAWLALKIGALSFGGGFVIVPMMRADVVSHHHWMVGSLFVILVALGQLTPGPVVATIAGVGYLVDGWSGAGLAAALAFGPSFVFVNGLSPFFDRVRHSPRATAFLEGAAPAAIGLIGSTAILTLSSFPHWWEWLVLVILGLTILSHRLSTPLVIVLGAVVGLTLL